jgi:DNA-binding NarL/FixJ family response regulator
LALKNESTQPFLIPFNHDAGPESLPRITVHLAISDPVLEKSTHHLLARNVRFSVVRGSIGYAAVSDVRIIDEIPDAAQLRVLDEQTPPKLLFIGNDNDADSLLDAVRAGAWSFVGEMENGIDLEHAIFSLVDASGSPLLKKLASTDNGTALLITEITALRGELVAAEPEPNPLTPKEAEILSFVARGATSEIIGSAVGLAEQTIKNYVLKILDKTRTQNRAHAAAIAAQRGWLPPLDEF